MQEGIDNGQGSYSNTDPDNNGVVTFEDTNQPPMNDRGINPNPDNAPANNGQPGTTFQELAAKKGFKSADDLANSYANLERKLSDPQRLTERPAPPNATQRTDTTPSQPLDNSERATLQRLAIRAEIQDLKDKYDDIGEFTPAILDKVKAYPNMPLEDAYKSVKFDAAREAARNEGLAEGRQEGADLAERKLRATTLTPGVRDTTPALTIGDQIKGARTKKDLEEIESMLPHA